jgi:phage tail-like protein
MTVAGNIDNLYFSFLFTVAINENTIAGFNEVSGLALETEVETLREGGVNDFEHQLIGPTKYSSRLVLKRGLGDPRDLWKWYLDVLQGQIRRQNVTIFLNDLGVGAPGQSPPPHWTFSDACPVKWTGPELRASNSAMAFEAIELVHRGVTS